MIIAYSWKALPVLFLMACGLHGTLLGQTFTGVGGPIPDNGDHVEFIIPVNDPGLASMSPSYGLHSICLNATHSWVSDLRITLISPGDKHVIVFQRAGDSGDDIQDLCLSDEGAPHVQFVPAPFTGLRKPMELLGDMNDGSNGNGVWKLRIQDLYPFADEGALIDWSLTFAADVPGPITIANTDLPLVLLNTFGQPIVNEPKIPAHMSIIHDPLNGNSPTDTPNIYDGWIGIERRGNYSNSFPQRPYNLETRDGSGQNLNVPLFGLPQENDWILLANYNDKSLLRNPLAFHLFRQMGHWAPNTRHCEVILNGQYNGIYTFLEKIKRDAGRVSIAELHAHENSGDDLTGGYIFKIDYHDPTNSWLSPFSPIDHPDKNVHFVYYYPKPDTITDEQKLYLQGFVAQLEEVLYGEEWTDPLSGYRAWMDTRSFIDYFLVNELSRNVDGFKKSRFFHKNKESNGGRLKAGPVWDFDWAWMSVQDCQIFQTMDGSGWSHRINDCDPDVNSPGWMVRLLQDPVFANELKCRYLELRETVLDTTHIFNFMDSVATMVDDAQQRHFAQYPVFGYLSGTPEVGALAADLSEEHAKMKQWISIRLQWLDENMPGQCLNVAAVTHAPEALIRVFPNPGSRMVHVESDRTIRRIELMDMTGRELLHLDARGTYTASLDISSMASGPHILRVAYVDGGSSVMKVVRE